MPALLALLFVLGLISPVASGMRNTLLMVVLPPESFIGRSLNDLDLSTRLRLTPIALRRGDDVTVNPHRDEVVKAGDELILIGRDDKLEELGA